MRALARLRDRCGVAIPRPRLLAALFAFAWLTGAWLIAWPSASQAASCLGRAGGPRWRVGIVPQLPPREIAASWTPVLKDVGEQSGQCFELVIPTSIPLFEKQLQDGGFDFAFLNPYHQVMARQRLGLIPLVRDGKTNLDGILVVRKDSPLRQLADLNGQTVAFPAPNSFGASLLMRALLARQGIRIKPDYLNTHSNVYRAVALGRAPAGGGVNNTWMRERPELRRELRILWRTPSYAPHPFSAASRVPATTRLKVQQAFLRLGATEQGRALLAKVQMPMVIKADYARDYEPLTRLGLERFVVKGGD